MQIIEMRIGLLYHFKDIYLCFSVHDDIFMGGLCVDFGSWH